MIQNFVTYFIVILGLVNVIRMASHFILSDIYDLRKKKNKILRKYKPLVSVVIPAYNEEKGILKCLETVYASSYKNIQVIVINDGSKDNTGRIVGRFEREFKPRYFKYIRQKNAGKARAMNYAMRYAKGSLVMTLDADSILHKEAIKNAVLYLKDKDIVAVASNVRIIKTKTVLGIIQYIEYLLGYKLKKAYTVLGNEYIVGGIAATFRKAVVKKVGFYDTDTITEDIDLTIKILRLGNKKNRVVYGSNVLCFTEAVPSLKSLYRQRFRWKYGRFQTLFKNRKLFLNRDKKYSKSLTFLQLPFVIYSELSFLLDPILFGFLVYVSIAYRDVSTYQDVFVFLAFYAGMAVITDEYTALIDKIECLFFIPLAYIFFLTISVVEYIALIKSLIDVKGIINASKIDKCNWEHVERSGVAAMTE